MEYFIDIYIALNQENFGENLVLDLILSIYDCVLLLLWICTSLYLVIIFVCLLYFATNYSVYLKYCGEGNELRGIQSCKRLSGCGRVLFVTAHPDDECMFFGPTIVSMVKSEAQVFLICLSVGDMYGLGRERKRELWAACETLGINPESLWLYKHDKLKDNPDIRWQPAVVASIILKTIETLDIDTVITFDRDGVSGHKNHCSIYKALSLLRYRKSLPSRCRVYLLDTVCLFRKYSFYADIIFSLFSFNSFLYVSNKRDHKIIVSAMAKHVSQYVWYRKLFMIFSRYAYINTLSTFVG